MEVRTRVMKSGNNLYARCPYACSNKTPAGYCMTTVCINHEHNGSGTFVTVPENSNRISETVKNKE